MKLKILSSGSQGNCAILEDVKGNQLIIDCGINYKRIIQNIDIMKVDGCLITHCHSDHSLSKDRLEFMGVDIYDHDNLFEGEPITINKHWRVLPIPLKHNVENFGFIIYSNVELKKILWCTDCMELPNIATKTQRYDLMALEINYDYQTASSTYGISSGYNYHNSLENTIEFLNKFYNKPRNVVGIHTSNSGLLNFDLAKEELKKIKDIENCYIAIKEMEIEI